MSEREFLGEIITDEQGEHSLRPASKEQLLQKYFDALSQKAGFIVNEGNYDTVNLSALEKGTILDELLGKQHHLIRPSHRILEYSLLVKRPELNRYIPLQEPVTSGLQLLNDRSSSRHMEIIKDYNSENTRIAHCGDLVYWQAFLSAIGWTFEKPITEQEITTFIVQHAEGFKECPEIDKKLVEQGFKHKEGPHKLATIKRRIGTLSVFLDLAGWPNPTHDKKIIQLLNKLVKMYGGSQPAGKAITRDILDDMVHVCEKGNKLIDIRDKAIFLFAWGSGGRRRSEVSSAEIKDLVKTPEGDFVYSIPKSKTDQERKGYPVPVKGRAAKALQDWLMASGITDGLIFRAVLKGGRLGNGLMARDIRRFVRKRLKQAGYDEKQYGAHSLRSGFVTEAGRRGKPIGDVMQMTTHRSVETVMRYYQAGNINNNSAANLAD